MADKLQVAFHWLASCGGCEVAVVDIDEKILDVVELMDIVFWPVALDGKYTDIEAMEDNHLDIAFINGAVRSTEQEHHAQLFRRKSKVIVAFGACSGMGGIPGLANCTSKAKILETVYQTTASTENSAGNLPQQEWLDEVSGATLTLPSLHEEVRALDQVIQVDYYLPGCPPQPQSILAAVDAIATGQLPPPPAVVAPEHSLCDTCTRTRSKQTRRMEGFKRPHTHRPTDPEQCLLEQGLICLGPVTRDGCGHACINANMGCRGCYGPTPKVDDVGLKFLSTVATLLKGESEAEVEAAIDTIADPLGTFYRFSLPHSTLHRTTLEVV